MRTWNPQRFSVIWCNKVRRYSAVKKWLKSFSLFCCSSDCFWLHGPQCKYKLLSMYCVILPTMKVFFLIFVSIQKPTNTFNFSSNSIYEIYIFYFSYIFYFIVNLFFIGKYILTYLLTWDYPEVEPVIFKGCRYLLG